MTLSAIVLTRNEERSIEDCLSSVSFADEMLVVDSGSADRTVALAEKYGSRVVTHPFTDFASQRNFAMTHAKGDWIFFIDADERVTPELAQEMVAVLKGSDPLKALRGLTPLCVYAIPRHNYFFGQRLRFGDARSDAPIRLFPRLHVTWIQPVHEKVETALPQRELKNPLLHYSTRDLSHYRAKVLSYVPLELETMGAKGLKPRFVDILWRPCAKFFFLYFWKLGILDGIAGFQYAILSACYYTFQKYWLYWRERKKRPLPKP